MPTTSELAGMSPERSDREASPVQTMLNTKISTVQSWGDRVSTELVRTTALYGHIELVRAAFSLFLVVVLPLPEHILSSS
jgi:hypothetical protein